MNEGAKHLVLKLGLQPLPAEGGFFAPTWTAPACAPGARPGASSILFLITVDDFSALHRLRMDEVWHHMAGDCAELVRLDPGSRSATVSVLGPDVAGGQLPQAVVPAGEWQGARIRPGAAQKGWTLFGCVVSPAWDGREFELGIRDALLREFPAHADLVRALTR
jgi:hypothetical protein